MERKCVDIFIVENILKYEPLETYNEGTPDNTLFQEPEKTKSNMDL